MFGGYRLQLSDQTSLYVSNVAYKYTEGYLYLTLLSAKKRLIYACADGKQATMGYLARLINVSTLLIESPRRQEQKQNVCPDVGVHYSFITELLALQGQGRSVKYCD